MENNVKKGFVKEERYTAFGTPYEVFRVPDKQLKEDNLNIPNIGYIVDPAAAMIYPQPYEQLLYTIERAARTCYQSEPKSDPEEFIRKVLARGHESVIEHSKVTFDIVTDRGISHELVRHRIASYSQESTRYVNYFNKSDACVFMPVGISQTDDTSVLGDYFLGVIKAIENYNKLIEKGVAPQTARAVLPTCLKTEIIVTMNLREWRHFIDLRCDKAAHPDMRVLAKLCGRLLYKEYPVFFEDKKHLFEE